MAHVQLTEEIAANRFEVFRFAIDPANVPLLLGPEIDVEVLTATLEPKRGAEAQFRMTRAGLTQMVRWRVEDVLVGSRLTYRQIEGVFQTWTHTMKFEELDETHTRVIDVIDYRLPFGLFGAFADDVFVKADLTRVLAARLKKISEHFVDA